MHERLMLDLHQKYPLWELDRNLGYCQGGHVSALERHGLCPEHRRTFRPINEMVERQLGETRDSLQLTIDI